MNALTRLFERTLRDLRPPFTHGNQTMKKPQQDVKIESNTRKKLKVWTVFTIKLVKRCHLSLIVVTLMSKQGAGAEH